MSKGKPLESKKTEGSVLRGQRKSVGEAADEQQQQGQEEGAEGDAMDSQRFSGGKKKREWMSQTSALSDLNEGRMRLWKPQAVLTSRESTK